MYISENYGSVLSRISLTELLNGFLENFISYVPLKKNFPYISYNGAFINFPILLFPVIVVTQEEVRKSLKEMHLWRFVVVLCLLPVLITGITVAETPFLLERYRMDIYWLMGFLCYMVAGCYYMNKTEAAGKKFSRNMMLWAVETVFMCFLLYLVPWDCNLTACNPEILGSIEKVLMLGLK